MKKIICAILCLSILLTGMIGITAASADVPVITETKTGKIPVLVSNPLTISMTTKGAPAKSGYYSSTLFSLSATYKRSSGSQYTVNKSKSASGGWGQGTASVTVTLSANSNSDKYVKGTYTRTYQYYGIR